MSNRYWVGDTGNWSAIVNWSASSGGAGGESVPVAADNVIFDANSFSTGTLTVTLDVYAECNNITFADVTNNPTWSLSASTGLSVFGDFTLASTSDMSTEFYDWIYFGATSTGKTVKTNGHTLANISFEGEGGGWTLTSNLICDLYVSHSKGILDLDGYTVTCYYFSSDSPTTRTLTCGSAIINVLGDCSFNTTNMTFNKDTSTIKMIGDDWTSFVGGGQTFYNVEFTGAWYVVSGNNTYNNIKISPATTLSITASSTHTITTLSGAGSSGNLFTIESTSSGTFYEIICASGTVVFDYCSIKDCHASGGATFFATDNSTLVSGNTGIGAGFIKIVSTALDATNDMTRDITHAVSTGIDILSTPLKQAQKILATSVDIVSSLLKVISTTINTSIDIANSLVKQAQKVTNTSIDIGTSLSRIIYAIKSTTISTVVSSTKTITKTFSTGIDIVASVLSSNIYVKTVSTGISVVSSIVKAITHTISNGVTISGTTLKLLPRTFNTGINIASSQVKRYRKS